MSSTSTWDVETESGSVDLDLFYQALANQRRRIAISVLGETPAMDLDALATSIAEEEGGESDREELEICLVHQHLPLLAEAGIVEYDSDNRRVTLERTVESFVPLSELPFQ